MTKQRKILFAILVVVFFIPSAGFAEESPTPVGAEQEETLAPSETDASAETEDKAAARVSRRITVADTREKALETAGSIYAVAEEELENKLLGTDDIHRVLRQVPGVNIQEEEGFGLRPNIGFRGVPNERSAKITLMEDGVLIAPAPYSAPAAYYFPPIARMKGVEVSKGPGQIKYGPYTTGGSLNMLSTDVPDGPAGKLKLGVGTNDLLKAYANVGNSWKYGGVLVETYQIDTKGFKDLDGGGDTGFRLEDYQFKGRINTDPDAPNYQELVFKSGYYDQISNETYLGLTDEDFGRTPYRRYAGSQLDNIDVDHVQQNLRHYGEFDAIGSLTTTLYYNETQRNWQKLERVGGTSIASILNEPSLFFDELDWIRGGDSSTGAFTVRQNQRDYESMGVQSVFHTEFQLANSKHELEIGVRYHEDEEDRYQREDSYSMVNGTLVLDQIGEPGSQANRISSAEAWAFHIIDTITYDRLTVTPGLRYELIDYERENYGGSDPTRSGTNLVVTRTDVDKIIPGVSVQYAVTDSSNIFAGVHRGFSPPGPSSSTDVREEESVNWEWGASYNRDSVDGKVVFFYTDYDNLLGADTLSSGGSGTGDLFNGGEVEVYGVEFTGGYDLAASFDAAFALPLRVSYTYTNAEFATQFDSDFFGSVGNGDDVPYIPQHQAYFSIGSEYEDFGLYFDGFFNDSMKTAAGEIDVVNETDSYMIFDLLFKWQQSEHLGFYASIENVFDRDYVVARRPAGARPGLPFTFVTGLEATF